MNYINNLEINSIYDFDNALSINELLCKFWEKIEEVINVSNESIDILNWIKEEGLPTEIKKIITELIEDGTIKTLPLARNIIVTTSPTLSFVNGEATYTLNKNDNNITYISAAFVMPFGNSNVFGIAVSSEDNSTVTFKIKCATDLSYSSELQCRLTFLCENQL